MLGGHSADVLRVDPAVTGFVSDAWQRGVLVGALECGQMVLMSAGIIDGQRVTGYRVVRPFLSRLGSFVDAPVVVDGNLITACDSDATPRFVRALARYFQPDWEDPTVDLLAGKRIVIVAGQDFEDVELCVPAMEFAPARRAGDPGHLPGAGGVTPADAGCQRGHGQLRHVGAVPGVGRHPLSRGAARRSASRRFRRGDDSGGLLPLELPRRRLAGGAAGRAAAAGKVVAAICHGPQVLAAADLVAGRRVAGFTACRDDVITMGGHYDFGWPAMIDGNIVTGRVPDDVPEFVDAITDALCGTRLLEAATAAPASMAR